MALLWCLFAYYNNCLLGCRLPNSQHNTRIHNCCTVLNNAFLPRPSTPLDKSRLQKNLLNVPFKNFVTAGNLQTHYRAASYSSSPAAFSYIMPATDDTTLQCDFVVYNKCGRNLNRVCVCPTCWIEAIALHCCTDRNRRSNAAIRFHLILQYYWQFNCSSEVLTAGRYCSSTINNSNKKYLFVSYRRSPCKNLFIYGQPRKI